jgi:hypothetical protein
VWACTAQTEAVRQTDKDMRLSKEEQDYAAQLGSVKPTVLAIFLKLLSGK